MNIWKQNPKKNVFFIVRNLRLILEKDIFDLSMKYAGRLNWSFWGGCQFQTGVQAGLRALLWFPLSAEKALEKEGLGPSATVVNVIYKIRHKNAQHVCTDHSSNNSLEAPTDVFHVSL